MIFAVYVVWIFFSALKGFLQPSTGGLPSEIRALLTLCISIQKLQNSLWRRIFVAQRQPATSPQNLGVQCKCFFLFCVVSFCFVFLHLFLREFHSVPSFLHTLRTKLGAPTKSLRAEIAAIKGSSHLAMLIDLKLLL